MFKLVFILIFLQSTTYTSAVMQCCQEPNIVVNRMCFDGSNVTILSCRYKHLVGPTMKRPENIEIDEYENLIITSEYEEGFIKIASDMYCITKDPHNTSDLAYVCYIEDEGVPSSRMALLYIKICCAFLTFIFSITTFIIYVFTKDLHDIEGKCVINILAGLCIEHLTVTLLPVVQSLRKNICNTAAFIYYTSILFCFIWLSVISFHIWRLTVRPIFRTQIKWFIIYCCYGFGVPLLILATALTYHHLQEISVHEVVEYNCLTLGSIGIWAYFYGPLLLILIMSITPLLWAAKRLWINIDRRETAQCVIRLRAKCRLFGHLIALMGMVLLFDVAMYSLHGQNEVMEYFWDILDCRNLLIGGAVFLILVVYRNKVLIALAKRGLFCIKFPDKWAKLVDDEREEKENEEATLTSFTSI